MNKKIGMKVFAVLLVGLMLSVSMGTTAYAASVYLIGISDTGHDHMSCFDDIASYLKTMGYSSIYKREDSKYANVKSMLDAGEIIVTRSHGGAFKDSSGNYIGNWIVLPDKNLYNSDIEDLKDGSLSNAKLIVYGGCLTAAGGTNSTSIRNLVVASEVKGASTVVGFTKEVSCVGVNFWVKKFFQYLSEGYNIDKALNQAKVDTQNEFSGVNTNIDSCMYRGEWSTTFN
ncbi:MAG: hypothetical protein K2O03_10800 [Lachnospiraceae bacterium]|nr:hypothetical protein [Lachnospiraceae bacterium]